MSDVTAIVQGAMNDLKASGADLGMDPGDFNTPEPEVIADPSAEPAPAPVEPAAEPVVPPVVDPAAPVPPVVPKPDEDEAELKTLEADLIKKTPGLAKGKISTARHQATVVRQRNKFEGEIATLKTKVESYERPEAKHSVTLGELAQARPQTFFKTLLSDPIYKAIIDTHVDEVLKTRGVAPPAAPGPAPVVDEKAPEPDVVLPGGELTYSAAAAAQLARFEAAQLTKTLQDQIKELQGQVKPVLSEREHTQKFNDAKTRQREAWASASTSWEGFKDHEQAIADLLLAPGNGQMTLDEAYRKVVIPAMKVDPVKFEADVRAKIYKEINDTNASRTAATRLPANGAAPIVPAPNAGARDTEEIIRTTLRGLQQTQ